MKSRPLYMDILKKWIDIPTIKIITGVRRCGKSNLLMLLIEELKLRQVQTAQILYINFESMAFDKYRHASELYQYVREQVSDAQAKGKVYILIDEIQNCSEWERAVASFMVDLNCDLYLTGSNAHLLSSDLATHIAGRYVEITMYPLTFSEYLHFNDLSAAAPDSFEQHFYTYLRYGGFPGLHLLPEDDEIKRQYIKGIFHSVVLKDAIQRNHIRDSELLERILNYLMDNIGQIFSAKKIADYFKSIGQKSSTDSIYSYISALESAMIIHAAKRYDIKGKKILERMEKYFLCDMGFRYAQIGYRDNDISQLLENIIYMELRSRGYQVMVGKEADLEVDFIAQKDDDKLYIQVTYLLAGEDVVRREYAPLLMIEDNYPKMVLSMDRFPIGSRDGILWMNIVEFLLKVGG